MDEKEKIAQDRSDVEWVTSTEQGRRFLWKVLSHCGVYHDFNGAQEDMLKQIGKRQVGLYLLGIISDASEDRIFEMMREAKNRSIEEKIHHERTSSNTRSIDSIHNVISGDDYGNGSILPGYSSSSSDSGGIF